MSKIFSITCTETVMAIKSTNAHIIFNPLALEMDI